MKQQWIVPLLCAVALWGCQQTDNVAVGVYQGVVSDDNQTPLAAQVLVQESASLLTLWDEREHQTSYAGVSRDGKLEFAAASVSCEMSGTTLKCGNRNGETQLSPVTVNTASLADFAGRYQARYHDALLQMSVDSNGAFTLSGSHCESVGSLAVATSPADVVLLQLVGSECAAAGSINWVTLQTDNESLISLNVQTDSDDFPQVWVRL